MSGRDHADRAGPEDPAATAPCPSANALAAFASGRLLDEEREPVERHLASCPDCRAAVAAAAEAEGMATAPAPATSEPRILPGWRLATLGMAAAVLLVLLAPRWLGEESEVPVGPDTTEARLSAAVDRLREAAPEALGTFEPLTAEARRAAGPGPHRGSDLRLLVPAGTILERTPTFAWTGGSGGAASLRLATATGETLFAVDDVEAPYAWPGAPSPEAVVRAAAQTSAPLPDPLATLLPTANQDVAALERSVTYLWEVEAEGLLGTTQASRTFRVASAEEARRWERLAEAAEAGVEDPLRDLLLAQVALHHEHLLAAALHARAYVEARPLDAVGRETLYQALVRIGLPDAARQAGLAASDDPDDPERDAVD